MRSSWRVRAWAFAGGLAAAGGARAESRDLATVLAEAASGPGALFVWGAVGVFAVVGSGVVVTSTLLRRPGVPADPALRSRARRRREDGHAAGVAGARGVAFRGPAEVVETLGAVALAPASCRPGGRGLLVELASTASSRAQARAGRPVCLWEAGFLEEGLRRFAAGRLRVREVECRAAGGAACRFEVEGLASLQVAPARE